MKILNLGCGTKVSSNADVLNIDWAINLWLKKNRVLRFVAPMFLKGERLNKFNSLPNNIIVHNLANGIPFASNSVDVVFHSHFLEHLDKDAAIRFLLEVKRVLRQGGIQRIVVPDLEKVCRAYILHLSICEHDKYEASKHDSYVAAIIEQSVRKEAFGTSQQKPLRRFIENAFLGDARRRGETHQWMYDRINLSALLVSLGYKNPEVKTYNQSIIPNWNQVGLDFDENDNEYKPGSLYIETQK